jgi:regulator of RNase E activity RraA
MSDTLYHFLSGQAFAMMMLGCGTLVVVVEAVRASRRALWGDMFTEDFDE